MQSYQKGVKATRSAMTSFERELQQKKGTAIVYTAYILKETHSKFTRVFATELGGIGNTVQIYATKDFVELARSLYNLKAGVTVFLQAVELLPYLEVGCNLETMGESSS